MIRINVTKEQLSDIIRGIELLKKESEIELNNMTFVGCSSKIERMFKNDIKDITELEQYLRNTYENN